MNEAERRSAKPKNIKQTTLRLMRYMKPYKFRFIIVIIAILLSSLSGAFGSYYIGEVLINQCIAGNMQDKLTIVIINLALVYVVGIIASLVYNRVMIVIAHKILNVNFKDKYFF